MEVDCPLVSIIVPVYNVEKYLEECIASILAQTYYKWELILVNDGSNDLSGNICDIYAKKDNRIRVIHQQNGGVSSARNTGLDEVSGEYIMFVDADDKIIPETLALMVEKAREFNADIVSAGLLHYKAEFEEDVLIWQDDEAIRHSLSDHSRAFSSCVKLYHKNIISENRFLTNVKINEDTLFLFELFCKKPKIINIKEQVYYYRPNEKSSSRAEYSAKFEDILLVSDIKYRIVKEKFPQFIYLADNMMLKARMNLLKILCVRTKSERKDLECELIRYIQKNHKSYISMNRYDDDWLKIVRYHLYYVYKTVYNILRKH